MVSAWRFVATFGVISLLADIVYEGARSITGPLLASLGATAVVVGVVTGIGEAAALILRLVSGPRPTARAGSGPGPSLATCSPSSACRSSAWSGCCGRHALW